MEYLVSILVGIVSGLIAGILTVRFNYKQLFAQTVSQNRMEWINNFREEFATIIAVLTTKPTAAETEKERTSDRKYEGNKARAKLLTRLNQDTSRLGNEYNEVFADMLMNLDFDNDMSFKEEQIKQLITVARKILEPEWQKVKREARGKGG